jgi:hypothetical protein
MAHGINNIKIIFLGSFMTERGSLSSSHFFSISELRHEIHARHHAKLWPKTNTNLLKCRLLVCSILYLENVVF